MNNKAVEVSDAVRSEFEEWHSGFNVSDDAFDRSSWEEGQYKAAYTQMSWLAWQAAHARHSRDAERLNWLEKQYGSNLVNDDAGQWAVSDMGMQEVTPEGGFTETTGIQCIVTPEQWKSTIREAIDAAMQGDSNA